MNPSKSCGCVLLLALCLIGAVAMARAGVLDMALHADRLCAVYTPGAEPVVSLPEAGTNLMWTVYDWKRDRVAGGAWPEGRASLRLSPFPKGYYYLEVGSDLRRFRPLTFCVVPDPATRSFPSDSFYGTDAALSWVGGAYNTVCNWYGENSYAATLDLLRLCGLPHARERMRWSDVSNATGRFAWGHYADSVRFARARGIRLLGMFHDCAGYAGKDGRRDQAVDLKAVYDFCRAYGEMGGDAMAGWEFGNEPDIGCFASSCWDYMSAMKAGYLGYKAANPDAPVLNGAVCKTLRNTFDELMFRNDLAKFCNIFNVHVYSEMPNYAECFRSLHDFMERMKASDLEIWVTESSNNVDGEAKEESVKPGCRAHSYEQELAVAESYAKIAVLLQMEGIARDYFFVFGAYSERHGLKDWGVQRRDGTVKPYFTAISAMTEHLVGAKIVGEKNVGEGIRCFVFEQPDGSQSIAYWCPSWIDRSTGTGGSAVAHQRERIDRPFSLKAADGSYAGANWCGVPFARQAKGGVLELVSERYVSYVDGLRGLTVDRPARPRGKARNYVPAPDEDLSVIVRVDFDPDEFAVMDERTVSELKSGHRVGHVAFHVWNLSGQAKRGHLELDGVVATGLPGDVVLPAWGKSVLRCELGLSEGSDGETLLRAWGVFGGKRSSCLAVPIRVIDRYLDSCDVVVVRAADRPEYWKMNDSAQEKSICRDEVEQAVRFDYRWTDPKSDAWVYPTHLFTDEDRAFSLDGAQMMEVDVKLDQDKVENDVDYAHLMVLPPAGAKDYPWVRWRPPSAREWTTVRIPFGAKPPFDGAVGFRLGFNPRGRSVRFWIRNLKLIKPKEREK